MERARGLPLRNSGVIEGGVIFHPSDGHGVIVSTWPEGPLMRRLADEFGPLRWEIAERIAIKVKLVDGLAEVDDVERKGTQQVLAEVNALEVHKAR